MNTDQLANFFKALSEPVRLRILNLLLQKGELCVCDIVSALSLPQSVVSRHLSYLKKHALVTSRRQGNWQYYECTLLNPTHTLHFLSLSLKQSLTLSTDCNQDLSLLDQHTGCSTSDSVALDTKTFNHTIFS